MNARRRFHPGKDSVSTADPSLSYVVTDPRTFVAQVNTNIPHSASAPAFGGFQEGEMTCRDRTSEFFSAVKSMQSRQVNGHIHGKDKALHHRSEFMVIARKIGHDLANTFAKLEKLAILAKRQSLFDDKPEEIQQLTYFIKQDIGSLNKQIAQLQDLSRHQRNSKVKQTHSNSIVVGLQQKLANMSNEFKSVLEVRTENLQKQRSRREEFSHTPVASSLPPAALSGLTGGSILLQDDFHSHSGSVSIDMDVVARQQRQLQIEEQDTYIQSRASTMQNIEQTIVELGGIFQQLAHMVKEQEEMVQRIDGNVDEAQLNVEAAHSEILKYFQSVTSNRWLMVKVFGVLIVFFIIFIVFMA